MGNRDFIVVFFALSLLAHILFLRFFELDTPALNARELSEAQKQQVIPVKVEVKALDQKEADKLGAHQIIELPPGPDQQPEHAQYLAERAMTAEKETMAAPGRSFAGHGAPPVPSQDLFQPDSSSASQPGGQGREGKNSPGLLDRLKLKPVEAASLFNNNPGLGPGAQGPSGHGGGIDFLGGAAVGDITMANAFKFKYAGFFNELKRSIAFYWNPEPALYLVPYPRANSELVTKVRFVIDHSGLLADLEVLSSSQYQAVDRAALSAIRNSTPVFNVPEELLDQNHQLSIICEFRILLGAK